MSKLLKPVHPGEILREEFLKPLGLSMNALALDLHVPVTRIAKVVYERRTITPDRTEAGAVLQHTARILDESASHLRPGNGQGSGAGEVNREVRPKSTSCVLAGASAG